MQSKTSVMVDMAFENGLPVHFLPLLSEEDAYERLVVGNNTYDWWFKAHRQAEKGVRDYKNFAARIEYHDRFRGYCPRCQKGD